MEKIICDICGTTYPSSSESCPICGCSNDSAAELLAADIPYEDVLEETIVKTQNPSGRSKKKEIFDFDEVNTEEDPEEETYEDDFEAEDEDENTLFTIEIIEV